VLLLKNMMKAVQLLDESERLDVSPQHRPFTFYTGWLLCTQQSMQDLVDYRAGLTLRI
jgi:hypothetical protein